MQWAQKQKGFTIVELLIVVVVIAILAAITVVAYNGINNRAKDSAIQSDISNAVRKLETLKLQDSVQQYPAILTGTGIDTTGVAYYTQTNDNSYCISKTNGALVYHATNLRPTPLPGLCGTSGIVGWYQLNNNSTDASTTAVNAVITGATTATGQGGAANTAFAFDGTTTQYLHAPTTFGISTTNLTLSAWVYSAVSPNKGLFVKIGNASGAVNNNGGIAIGMGSGSGFGTPGSSFGGLFENSRWIMSVTPLGANTWHHVAMTVDSSGTPSLFVNGNRIGVYLGNNATAPSFAGTSIGGYAADRFFNGRIDDVRIYNRALNSAEIQGLHAAGAL